MEKINVSHKKAKKLTVSRKEAKILTVNRKSHYPIETLMLLRIFHSFGGILNVFQFNAPKMSSFGPASLMRFGNTRLV